MEFISFASGSSGNCYYFGSGESGFIIDAGISPRAIKKRLADLGKSTDTIKFILVTHSHIDHIRHLTGLAKRYSLPVFSSDQVHKSVLSAPFIGKDMISHKRVLEKDVEYLINDFKITLFEVPHDAEENLAFFIENGETAITLMTDIGEVTDKALHFCRRSSSVVLESNYDTAMLINGSYPAYLKARIKGNYGHLSNEDAAEAITKFYHEDLRNIFLCHLSINNNTPELAYSRSESALKSLGADVGKKINLHCLPRREHRLYEL